ncbi:hypothetical protein CBL_06363 [Carabus blaptoides fortunei]
MLNGLMLAVKEYRNEEKLDDIFAKAKVTSDKIGIKSDFSMKRKVRRMFDEKAEDETHLATSKDIFIKECYMTWQDMRSRTKCKKSETTKRMNKTGGGGECSKGILTDIEEQILQIVGKISVEGHQEARESSVQMISYNSIHCKIFLANPDLRQITEDTRMIGQSSLQVYSLPVTNSNYVVNAS